MGIDKDSQRINFSLKSSNDAALKFAGDFLFDSWGAFNFTAGIVYTNKEQGSIGTYVNSYK